MNELEDMSKWLKAIVYTAVGCLVTVALVTFVVVMLFLIRMMEWLV